MAAEVEIVDGSADTAVVKVGLELSEDGTSGTPACVLDESGCSWERSALLLSCRYCNSMGGGGAGATWK